MKWIGCLVSLVWAFFSTDVLAVEVVSQFQNTPDRIWVGPGYWANPMEDWRIQAGLFPDQMQVFRHMACQQVVDGAHESQLALSGDGNTFLYQAYLGRIQTESNMSCEVFVDDNALRTGSSSSLANSTARTWYDGISYAEVSSNGSVRVSNRESTPGVFGIGQNYPNPFNQQSVISYQLSAGGHVMVKVYDIHGREIATLVDERQEAGKYQIQFDGSNRSSGIYFCRFITDSDIQSLKMSLIK